MCLHRKVLRAPNKYDRRTENERFASGKACPERQRGELEAGHPRMGD